MGEVKDYGEPWMVQSQFNDFEHFGRIISRKGGFSKMPKGWMQHACTCVNAFAGHDPDKDVVVSREDLQKYLSNSDYSNDCDPFDGHKCARAPISEEEFCRRSEEHTSELQSR